MAPYLVVGAGHDETAEAAEAEKGAVTGNWVVTYGAVTCYEVVTYEVVTYKAETPDVVGLWGLVAGPQLNCLAFLVGKDPDPGV